MLGKIRSPSDTNLFWHDFSLKYSVCTGFKIDLTVKPERLPTPATVVEPMKNLCKLINMTADGRRLPLFNLYNSLNFFLL